ncbi:MAG: SGNH/GDSL hydrolase family protein [Planctomycetes bacterium]|nr:SGNH/GDSL hydrolase family protein [Planctomycetota bacterium]
MRAVHLAERPAALVSMWRRMVLFVGGMFIILGATEGYLALVEPDTIETSSFNARHATPYVEFYSKPNFTGRSIITNDAGFRYGPLPVEKPVGELRVFFLASSVGFRGKANETTIAGYMESLLAAQRNGSKRHVRVINASGTSFTSTQSLVLLVTKILKYQPDVLVVFHGPESLLYPSVYENRPGYPFNFRVRERIQNRTATADDGVNSIVAILNQFRLTRHFHPNLARNVRQAAIAQHNYVTTFHSLEEYDPYIDTIVDDVARMVRIAAAYDCRTMIAIPPWQSAALLPGAVERLAERVQDQANRYAGATRYIDTRQMTNELSTRRLWQADGVHWNDDGNRLIATYLAESLEETGWLERAP